MSRAVWSEDNSAVSRYLGEHGSNPWVTMALAALGETPSVSYLKDVTGTTALQYEAPVLALSAAGENPRTYPREDFVAKIKGFVSGGQIGDAGLLNDDIFGILALVAAGEPVSDPVIQGAKAFMLGEQRSSGDFAYGVGAERGDTNTTAVAIMALRAAGVPKEDGVFSRALAYLESAQNSDGGFPYDPESPYGVSSDASSDAWVISALSALDIDPASWKRNGRSPLDHLRSLETEEGYLLHEEGGVETSFTPTETAYAAVALAGSWYPVSFAPSSAPSVGFRIEGEDRIVCEGNVRARTALDVVSRAAETCGFSYHITETAYGPYLDAIGDDAAEGVRGWLYTVNMLPLGEITVGASEYLLSSDDFVLWFYGEWGENPPRSAEVPLSVSFSSASSLENGGNANDIPAASVLSFMIADSSGSDPLFRFDRVSPGETLTETFVLENTGTVSLSLESEVTGDRLFRDYLRLGAEQWQDFQGVLNEGERSSVDVVLPIPSSYAAEGTKGGTLVFWAGEK